MSLPFAAREKLLVSIIHGFSIALIFGVLIGTYSSIYIASPVTLALGIKKEDLMPIKKEGLDLENQP